MIDSSTVQEQRWDRVIRPQRHLFDLHLRELWEFRDLVAMFVRRDVVTQYKQTVLGPVWYFVQPLLTMLMYIVVFRQIAGLSTDQIPAPLFYLSGIILWNYFSECLNRTSGTFTNNAHIFGKVYFPRLIVPVGNVISGLLRLLIQGSLLLLLYGVMWWTGANLAPGWWLLSLPWLILLLAGFGLGFGVLFSALTNKYRDLRYLLDFGMQLWMYGTPIIYPLSLVNERLRGVLFWNPLTHVVEAFRAGVFGKGEVSWIGLAYSTAAMCVVLIVGILVFNRTEQTFLDTV